MANKIFIWSGTAWEEVITAVAAHAQEHLAGGLDPLEISANEIRSYNAENRDVLVADGAGSARFEKNPNIAMTWWMGS